MIAEAELHGKRRGSTTPPGSTPSPDGLEATEVATEWDDQSRTTAPSTAYARSTATSSTTTQGTAISAGHPQGDGGRINVDAEAPRGQATEIAWTAGRARHEIIRLPRKFDPRDGRAYTFAEIYEYYKPCKSDNAIQKFWRRLAPVTAHDLV